MASLGAVAQVLEPIAGASDETELAQGLGMAFGVPQCMLEIAGGLGAALLPTTFLGALSLAIKAGKEAALRLISDIKSRIFNLLGLKEDFDFKLTSIFGIVDLASIMGDIAGVIGTVAGAAAAVTENLQEIEGELAAIKGCLNQLSSYQKLKQGTVSIQSNEDPDYLKKRYATEIAQVQYAADFIKKADAALNNIDQIIYDRSLNPDLEPIYIDPSLSAYSAAPATTTTEPIFRLVYGPPKSKFGQFILSVDGLYYDSQKGGIPQVQGFVPAEDRYKFEYPSNIGGKGEMVSMRDLDKYVNTVFDLKVIDDSPTLQTHYDADHLLQVLIGQKNKQIMDVSAQVQTLVATGEALDSAIVINTLESLNSISAHHDLKINKRKKQIEVAIKAPYLFGTTPKFEPGKVPINDFSHLKDLNLAVTLEKQSKLVFSQGDVSGVVLPIKPKYVKPADNKYSVGLDHLIIPKVGTGAIIYDNDAEGAQGTILSLVDSVVTDNLIGIYNFLNADVVNPGSDEFTVLNCTASGAIYDNAQLVSLNSSSVFTKGLSIPKLTGMVKLSESGNVTTFGNYVRLPNTKNFQNLLYKKVGATIEAWVYAPNIGSSVNTIYSDSAYGASSFHRLILACENTGGEYTGLDEYKAGIDNSIDVVRGLVMGFTRDRQITQSLVPSGTTDANPASAGMFYIAPTRSVNSSSVAFLNKASYTDCATGYEVFKLGIPLSATIPGTTKKIGDVSGQFMHFAVTINPESNNISVYVDGILTSSTTLTDAFGVIPGRSLNVPSFARDNSFSYELSSTGTPNFAYGPFVAANNFTPWIVGGGFTDGNHIDSVIENKGFMGKGHGLSSGLNGHVGSLKFYSKPLTSDEVLANYTSQQGMFKNIDLG